MHKEPDVIIIGAGLSGLYTALLLHRQGVRVAVLEARPRLGGRIHGMEINNSNTLDLGPSWFWLHQTEMQRLCQQLDVSIFEQYTQGEALYQASSQHPVERFSGAGSLMSYRIQGGVSQVIAALAQTLPEQSVHPDETVTSCQFKRGRWHVTSTSQTLQAKQLIIAAPPRVALATTDIGKVLSADLHQALLSTPTWMASQAKFVAHYPQPFWRQQGLAGDAFSRVGPLVEIHDASAAADRDFALFGFIGVHALQRANLSAEALSAACLQQLGDIFGSAALAPTATALEDWSRQPFTCTAADIQQAPLHPECDLQPFAAELKQLQLNFASTEVARHEAGYLEGALVAASVAASVALQHTALP